MKKLIYKLVLAGVFLMTINVSCDEDNLDTGSTDVLEKDYFKSDFHFESALTGVYSRLVVFYGMSAFNLYGAGTDISSNVHSIMLLPGDDVTTTNVSEGTEFFGLTEFSGKLTAHFFNCYSLIRRASYFLENNERAANTGVYSSETLRLRHRGEALFLRAYAYYLLWNVFGTAPVVREYIRDQSARFPSSTGTELLDAAITDLQEAATLLPVSQPLYPNDLTGRVTRKAGYGFLGKCLVFRASVSPEPQRSADYQAALEAFSPANLSGASLVANWIDNFRVEGENNAESLFEFQANNLGGNIFVGDPDPWDAIGSTASYWGFYDNTGFGGSNAFETWKATQKVIDEFNTSGPGDPRLTLSINTTAGANYRRILKYVGPGMKGPAVNATGSLTFSQNNVRILRYADIVLLRAEAQLRTGDRAGAIASINEVRARARNITTPAGAEPADRNVAETDDSVIMNWIKTERLIELAGEGQRWFDVRRWFIGDDLSPDANWVFQNPSATLPNTFFSSDNTNVNAAAAPVVNAKTIFFPIPYAETIVNPNIVQNVQQ